MLIAHLDESKMRGVIRLLWSEFDVGRFCHSNVMAPVIVEDRRRTRPATVQVLNEGMPAQMV